MRIIARMKHEPSQVLASFIVGKVESVALNCEFSDDVRLLSREGGGDNEDNKDYDFTVHVTGLVMYNDDIDRNEKDEIEENEDEDMKTSDDSEEEEESYHYRGQATQPRTKKWMVKEKEKKKFAQFDVWSKLPSIYLYHQKSGSTSTKNLSQHI